MTKTDDGNLEFVRAEGQKKRAEFAFCKWAAQLWEAEYYASTPTHQKSIDRTLKVMINDPCWYSTIHRLKTDTRALMRKINGGKKPRRMKKNESTDE